jgi:hypothetical protein
MWGFLTEFWNSISGVVLDAWNYTAEWFQNVGYAVAGAIGGLFDWILHYLNDFFVLLGWALGSLKVLYYLFTLPFAFIFNFIRNFFDYATQNPVIPSVSFYSTSTMDILGAIPYWNTAIFVLGICIMLIGGIGIVYLFLKA